MTDSKEDIALDAEESQERKKPQFGTRFLTDPKNVFQHNAWDNVVWDEEQEAEARQKTLEQLDSLAPPEKQEEYEKDADRFWDKFYDQHQNRFFKDRHWLFTEFPELYSSKGNTNPATSLETTTSPAAAEAAATETLAATVTPSAAETTESQSEASPEEKYKSSSLPDQGVEENTLLTDDAECNELETNVGKMTCGHSSQNESESTQNKNVLNSSDNAEKRLNFQAQDRTTSLKNFPGESASFRILEVGCGVGNTVFPVLNTNNDRGLMVYCCDFSTTAVQLVKEHRDYDPQRCHAFVWDITDDAAPLPFPPGSLDIIIMIFVLSAVHPDKMQAAVHRLARCLKPGGQILLRDYGRYDMAQLRFKKGRCLAENFYVRGDGTRVYFFTQEEFRIMFQAAGLEEVQNLIDRRLQVNRGRQLKMYRVWIQCKYRKPLTGGATSVDKSQTQSS